MTYKEVIGKELVEIVNKAPRGVSTHYLEDYDQKDVLDTVNYYHAKYPDNILLAEQYFEPFVPIVINK